MNFLQGDKKVLNSYKKIPKSYMYVDRRKNVPYNVLIEGRVLQDAADLNLR